MPPDQLYARISDLLTARRPAALAAAAIFALAIGAQVTTHRALLEPRPTIATGWAVSATLGWLNGHGLRVVPEEAQAAKLAGLEDDLLALYQPTAQRVVAQEPLPATPLAFIALASIAGELRFAWIVWIQIALHALGAAALFLELRFRDAPAALLAGLGWAVFLPQFRSTLTPGYDSLTTVIYLGAVLGSLHGLRTSRLPGFVVAGLFAGLGLWVRSYLFVLPAVILLALAIGRRLSMGRVLALGLPVALFALTLPLLRPASGPESTYIRGGVWHSFWAGVGQFENPFGLDAQDATIRDFAEKLDPDADFRVPNYQYLPRYDDLLRQKALDWLPEGWPRLVRNAAIRVVWIAFPSFTPSETFASGARRALILALGLPVSLLALLGLAISLRRDAAAALVLAAPLLSQLPLAPFYFIAKVPTSAFFAALAFAGLALGRALQRRGAS